MFPYLPSWIWHPPRRPSVLQKKRVTGPDGKLLKCPEGSSSSVLLKKGRRVWELTHRCLEGSKLPWGIFGCALLQQMSWVMGRKSPLLMVFKCSKLERGSLKPGVGWDGGVPTLLAHQLMQSWQMETLSLLLSQGCCPWLFLPVTGSFLCYFAEFFSCNAFGTDPAFIPEP